MRKWVTLPVLLLVAALVVSGCGQKAAAPGGQRPVAQEKKLLFATGGTAGTYYPLGGAMAQVWNKKLSGVNVTVQATGGSVENVRLLGTKQAELGLCMNDVAYYGQNGLEVFKEKNERYTNYSAIGAIYPEIIQIFARKDSGIKDILGFKGKRVSVGPPGSGTEVSARQILGVYGLDYKERKDFQAFYLSYSEAANYFKDRQIDAAYFVVGVPNAALQDISTVVPIQFMEIDDQMLEKITQKYPYYSRAEIPANSYKGQDKPVKTVTLQAILLVRNDVDEQLVYDLTKTLYESDAEVAQGHAMGKFIALETATKGIAIPFHPGAAKYFREKGILK